MTDERRMTTDRFYGGVSNRLQNLRLMLNHIHEEQPSRTQLNKWVIANTQASSTDAVSHHLSFLESIELIDLSDTGCEVVKYGQRWPRDQNPKTLYEALSSGVKGFDTILKALRDGPMTDEEIMNLLVSEFDEAEMSTPGPAIRHREWLQVLGFIERDGDINRLTTEGRELLEIQVETSVRPDNDDLNWLDAMRLELERYREQNNKTIVTLNELYDFSERRLSVRFPNNNHVRAKIRQQLQRLRDHGEVEFLDEQGMYRIKVGDKIRQEKTELERVLDSKPELTEDSEKFTESRRRARDHAFTELVKNVYNYTCAICGKCRETPAGNPEVEAAHIYPKREGGSDDVRNGIALCKLHHWAFDSGWFSISDGYDILVKDLPERDGYYEFKQLEGNLIELPDEEEAEPHAMFLREHRQIHGFDND